MQNAESQRMTPRMYHVKLEQFQGPFSLLVQLIDEKKLSINEISLGQVTEQFLEHMKLVEETHPEELADFLVVASKLLLIKSRTLLPVLEVDEDEGSLEDQLKLYQAFVKASQVIEVRLSERRMLFARTLPKLAEVKPVFTPDASLTLVALGQAMLDVLNALQPILTLPERLIERAISIQEKLAHIRDVISKRLQVRFSQVLSSSASRVEVVVSFLAVLELLKQRTIRVSQSRAFHDILIKRV